jgi:hypothetical protein
MRVGCLVGSTGTLGHAGGSSGAPYATETRRNPVGALRRRMLTCSDLRVYISRVHR